MIQTITKHTGEQIEFDVKGKENKDYLMEQIEEERIKLNYPSIDI